MSTGDLQNSFRAQFGEDGILWEVFRRRRHGFFVEVGAYDGVALSNTYFLEQMGWTGILVEPIHPLCVKAARARPHSRVVHAACGRRGAPRVQKFTIADGVPVLSFLKEAPDHRQRCLREGATLIEVDVPVVTLDDVLLYERKRARQSRTPPAEPRSEDSPRSGEPPSGPWQPNAGWRIDLVSIDVEGGELDVLDGFNLDRFRPRVMVIENERESGQAVEPYLAQRGYRKFHRQVINDFYVRNGESTADLKLDGLDECALPKADPG